MTKKENNKYAMYKSLLTVLDENREKIKDIEGLKNQLYPTREKRRKTIANINQITKLSGSSEKIWDLVKPKSN